MRLPCRFLRFSLAFGGFLVISLPAFAQPAAPEPTYWQDIRPIFRKHCTACHSTKNLKEIDVSGGLALDQFEATKKGSKRQVVIPSNSAKSLLHELLVTTDVKKRMPLDSDPLSKEKIALIKKWIDSGAREGIAPQETATLPTTKKAPTRKLDLLLPTSAAVPAGLVGNKTAGKLELALKIGPLAPITAVAFSPDNALLATGSYGQVVIWDLNQARPAKLLTNVLGAVNDIRFSPKGDILAVGGGQPSAQGDLRLYQVSDWKLLATLRGHDDVVFSLAFSPDGQQLASASFDHSVRLWNVATREAAKVFHHHSDFVYAVAFSPSGKQLVSTSKDRTVVLFDVQTGKSVFTFSGMEQDVMAVAFNPDGKSVISSGFESGIYWWNTQTGERIKIMAGHSTATHELAFSKDGKRIVSVGADRLARTWDSAAGTLLKSFAIGSVGYSVAISSNNKYIAAGSFDGVTRIWDEASTRQYASLIAIAGDSDQPEWLAQTPEGYAAGSDKLIAQGRWRVGGEDVSAASVWAALRQPATVAAGLRGETLAAPKFDKK